MGKTNNDFNIDLLLKKPTSPFEKFHKSTKIKKVEKPLQPNKQPEEWHKILYKGYSRMLEIVLPKPNLSSSISLKKALYLRKSGRTFTKKLTLKDLSSVLYFSGGERSIAEFPKTRRFYPSAGARYPLEIYIISLHSELPKGLYHYYIKNNSLEELIEFDTQKMEGFINKEIVLRSSCIVVITSVFNRNINKYGDRGYRHILTEVGCLTQNFYLVSGALDFSCCALGGYVDDAINSYLDIDGIRESVVGVLLIG
ncbi:MAG: hypothetical protein COX79_00560 [Candidatus Levybacteria bacterium CG_4_10_14_0_2_um_filter_36_16]|nr:MAG: hypothetical protein AUK12_03555 [Candidatus Levybacteria bacterium CG2_30_37_29]PIR79410.1 MAG: hypothetical protein COU26_01320 [Candidatus Levybacteria bacterium CG10_big_fil_rev_8_21_14_0_10_36_30]PIZ97901.1 MAG: hypothetical protein COX79_00560 [Candidatus Levybacteria bacterium CG_4_10_14_0_2_um_filter_36_16]